ncbi:amino acid adenylation enzyme/thioester reductase family protein [Paenibacillus riograndensis SBR5]|uniref:Amino acid adenylation enzyme/thioester reductase family protein n=2 Tax=Paenibacillus riograndensis TaxID=483937 RepID=A0A0E3WGU6_9BACL|nr:amino acid adenylation enzyme/thioester reductase family protein [Paenibacillus riograndensis SBR5]
MINRKEINDHILQLLKSGNLNQEMAVSILEKVNRSSDVKRQDIAVIGIACRVPGADTPRRFWGNLLGRVNSIGAFPEERLQDLSPFIPELEELLAHANHQAGYLEQIAHFDHPFFRIGGKEAMAMEPYQRLFLETAYHAIEDAGYGGDALKHSNTGVFVGLETAYQSHYRALLEHEDISSLTGSLVGLLANRISYFLDLRGPALVVNTACSSGLVALHQACLALMNKECETALVGGVNLMVIPQATGKLNDLETSLGQVKAFDKDADGTIWSEGITALLVKPLEKALKDRDPVYAVIKASGVNADGASNGLTAPNPEAETGLFIRTWEKAKIDPLSISYVEAHGTGTLLGDSIELQAINDAFKKYTNTPHICGIGSVKTNIGHTVAASGLASLLKVILSLKHKKIPPSLNYQSPNPFIDADHSAIYVNTEVKDWERRDTARRAGVNSFGFSGTNCHVVVEEAPEMNHQAGEGSSPFHFLTLSAGSTHGLARLIQAYYAFLQDNDQIDLEDLCYTANTGRGHSDSRAAFVFATRDELMKQLANADSSRNGISGGNGIYISGNVQREDLLTAAEELEPDRQNLQLTYEKLAERYVGGFSVDWAALYPQKRQKLNLPGYPFEKIKLWPTAAVKSGSALEKQPDFQDTANPHEETPQSRLYHHIQWLPVTTEPSPPLHTDEEVVLVLTDSTDWGQALAGEISRHTPHVIHARLAAAYQRESPALYSLAGTEADFCQLLKDTGAMKISKILFAAGMDDCDTGSISEEERLTHTLHTLLYLTKAWVKQEMNRTELILAGKNGQRVLPSDQKIYPYFASLYGMGKVIREEYSGLHCRCIDCDESAPVRELADEVFRPSDHYQIAIREGKKYYPQLTPVDLDAFDNSMTGFKEQGVYVITGGTGGIGLQLAQHIALKHKVKLVLISRSRLPARESWEELIQSAQEPDERAALIHSLKHLESNGSQLFTYSADVAELDELSPVISRITSQLGKIDGIIHAAGLPGSGLLIEKDGQSFAASVAAKIKGTRHLHLLTRDNPPDFLLLFSSIASVVGGIYLGDYVAGNSYLDAFSGLLAGHTRLISINWTTWMNTGMAKNTGGSLDVAFRSILPRHALHAFDQILGKKINNIVVGSIQFNNDLFWNRPLPVSLAPAIREQIKHPEAEIDVRLTGRADQSYTEIEQQIARIWGNLFQMPNIDIQDNFYELGGTSIMGIKIANRINEQYRVTMTIQDVFTHLTVASLGKLVEQKLGTKTEAGAVNKQEVEYAKTSMPLSHAQRRIWFLQKMNPDLVAYNLPFIRYFDMAIDLELLQQAASFLAGRHLLMRTKYVLKDGNPVQEVLPAYVPAVQSIDAAGQSDPELFVKMNIHQQKMKPFNLEMPPYRIYLYTISDERACLYINFHHILTDGWSIDIYYRELFSLYQAFLHQQPPRLPEVKEDYFDWILEQKAWEESEAFVEHEQFWLKELAKPLPVLSLPSDHKAPAVQTYRGSFHKFTISGELYRKLKAHLETQQITANNFLLSAYFLLLHNLSQEQDIIIGVPASGRNEQKWESVAGIFINTLCIRIHFQGITTFMELQDAVKHKVWSAMDKAQYPFDLLVEKVNPDRDLSRNPIYNVLFQFYDKLYLENEGISPFELSCLAQETNQQIEISFEYNSDMYTDSTISRFAGYFLNIIGQVVDKPEGLLREITLLTLQEQTALLSRFQGEQADLEDGQTIHGRFEAQVQKNPHAIALVYEEQQMTFQEVNGKANQLAWMLTGSGVQRNTPVGIFVDRSFSSVIGILAILKAGGAYVPLDPGYPEDRIAYILAHSGAKWLLTENRYLQSVAAFAHEEGIQIINLSPVKEQSAVSQMYLADYEDELSRENPRTGGHGPDRMYIMYTSGSTGKPKGVLVTHSNVLNFVTWSIGELQLQPKDALLLVTSISFDISVFEIFAALLSGSRLCIASMEHLKDTECLLAYMEAQHITIWHSVPSLMVQLMTLLRHHPGRYRHSPVLQQLRHLMLGGEAWSTSLAASLRETFPQAEIRNMYGPTEATIWVSSYKPGPEIDESHPVMLIGRPIANNRLIILDQYGNVCPPGVAGEIYIAGNNVTQGYYNDEEKTRMAFIPQSNGQIFYKTGDSGRYLPEGNVEFTGRRDQLVKVRGYRIELGEIEQALKELTSLQQIAVTAVKDGETSKIVCLYTGDQPVPQNQLKDAVRKRLPEYMIPAQFFHVERFLLTPNGKMDWRSMEKFVRETPGSIEAAGIRNEVDKKLSEIWKKLLGIPAVGIQENFFDIGGNSLLVVQMQGMIQQEFFQDIPMMDLFKYTSIEKISDYLQEHTVKVSSVETGQKRADMRKRLRNMRG